MPDATAKKLMDEALGVEEAEVKLKRTYQVETSPVLPAAKRALSPDRDERTANWGACNDASSWCSRISRSCAARNLRPWVS